MARPRSPLPEPSRPAPPSMSDSVLAGNMKFAGMVKTLNGYAVAVVELTPDGKMVSFSMGKSQALPQYVAPAAKQTQAALAQEVQRRPGRLT